MRLYILVLLTILPAFTIVLLLEFNLSAERKAQAQTEAMRLAEFAASELDRVIEAGHGYLLGMTTSATVSRQHTISCSSFTTHSVDRLPQFSRVAVLDMSADSICPSLSAASAPSELTEQPWFVTTGGTRSFFTGGYTADTSLGRAVLPLVQPVADHAGQMTGAIVLGLDLEWLAQHFASRPMLPGSAVTIVDRDGTVLVRLPELAQRGSLLPAPQHWMVSAPQPGLTEMVDSDGIERIVGYVPAAATASGAFSVMIGLSRNDALKAVDEAAFRTFFLIAVAVALSLLSTWTAGAICIRRPLGRLIGAVERFRKGDYAARADLDDAPAEVSRLGMAFDTMAATVESRERALRTSEARFRHLATTVPDVVWTADPEGNITYANDRWFDYTGLDPERNAHEWVERVLHPDDRERSVTAWTRALRDGTIYEVEVRNRGQDGEYRWFLTRALPVRDEQNRITAWFGSTTDIHDRKVAEAELALSAARLRLALEAVPLGVWEWEPDRDSHYWSSTQRALMGLDATEPTPGGKEFLERLVHPEDRDRLRATAEAAMRDGHPFSQEFRIRRPDGNVRWVAAQAIVVDTLGPRRMIGVSFDITERKQAEEQQQLLLAELSHRVKNAFATVQSIAQQSLTEDRPIAAARQVLMERIQALAQTHDLLTASRWRGADIRALVEAELVPYGERTVLHGEELLLRPRAALTLRLLLHELATNAAKYGALSVAQGRVEVAWEVHRNTAAHTLRLTWTEQGGPKVQPPERYGFGRRLIERAIVYELKGKAELQFRSDGVRYELAVPLGEVLACALPVNPADG